MLRIIREKEAKTLEATWNSNDKERIKALTANYVLPDSSLKYFKKFGTQAINIFRSSLYTENEYCVNYREYKNANGQIIQISVAQKSPNSYIVSQYDIDNFSRIKSVIVNRYVLKALSSLYGYGVRNAQYLVAFHQLHKFDRDPADIYAYQVVSTDGLDLFYTPYVKIIYKDGSIEQYKGRVVTDSYKLSPFNERLRYGAYYAKDILEDSNYKIISKPSPF